MGRVITVELLKYPGRPSRTATTELLGSDAYGTWLGRDRLVYLIPHQGWWKARHFPDGGWKVDIATPPVWDGDTVTLEDLALDVRRLHGRVWVEDEDEFADEVAAGTYPLEVAAAARRTCDEVVGRMHDEPFRSVGDRWLARVPGRFDGALLLDMGGVLCRSGSGAAAREWEARLGLGEGEVAAALVAAIGPGWEGGRLSLPDTTAVAVVSNNGADVRRVWEAAYDISSIVEVPFISGEERVAKPDPLLYQIAVWRLGVEPARCVFVDDVELNVEAARRIGMAGIHHTPPTPGYDRVVAALERLREE